MLVLVACVTLAVGGVGIMNIMLANVRARVREIGIRKALGATYREIKLQFLAEAVIISLVGGVVGSIAGLSLPLSVRFFTDYDIPISAWSVVIALTRPRWSASSSGLCLQRAPRNWIQLRLSNMSDSQRDPADRHLIRSIQARTSRCSTACLPLHWSPPSASPSLSCCLFTTAAKIVTTLGEEPSCLPFSPWIGRWRWLVLCWSPSCRCGRS